jgi:hypothetical protein
LIASLMGREGRLPAEPNAVRHGARPAFAGARADQVALELGKAAEHGQHQAAVRCRGVGPVSPSDRKPAFFSAIVARM